MLDLHIYLLIKNRDGRIPPILSDNTPIYFIGVEKNPPNFTTRIGSADFVPHRSIYGKRTATHGINQC